MRSIGAMRWCSAVNVVERYMKVSPHLIFS